MGNNRVIGMEITEVVSHKAEVMEAIEHAMHEAVALMAEEVEGNAKKDCPVDTGLLRNSLTYAFAGQLPVQLGYADDSGGQFTTYEASTPASDDDSITAYVGTNVEYAPYVEFGSQQHLVGKSHFLRDGATQHIPRLKSICETTLKKLD